MAVWVADNGLMIRVFDSESQAREWLNSLEAPARDKFRLWNMMSRG